MPLHLSPQSGAMLIKPASSPHCLVWIVSTETRLYYVAAQSTQKGFIFLCFEMKANLLGAEQTASGEEVIKLRRAVTITMVIILQFGGRK